MKAEVADSGKDIISLGIGNPDRPTPAHVIEELDAAAINLKRLAAAVVGLCALWRVWFIRKRRLRVYRTFSCRAGFLSAAA